MRHFRVQDKTQNQNEGTPLSFDQKLHRSLKSIVKLLPFVEFTVNYGFAIENVWVTMLMITHGNPELVDSFVWIVPIIIAIILRPYLIRFVHNINYKVYRQITLVSVCLISAAFGCYLVGLSCELDKKSQFFRRIFQCSVGWTIMDVAFEFCQFLTQKIESSFNELHQNARTNGTLEDQQKVQDTSKKTNFQFYGLFLGYIVSLLICWVIHGRTIKQFYRCCKYAYWTVAGLSLMTGLRLQMQSYINLPPRQQEDKQSQQKVFEISYDPSYYLPGLEQLLRANFQTLALLLLHFTVIFLNDIIMIYTTMWFSEPKGVKFAKPGDALSTGLEYGSISLIFYTVIDNLKINKILLGYSIYFERSLLSIVLFSILTFFIYGSFTFLLFGSLIAFMNQFYRHTVFNNQSQNNPIFQRCIEIVQRIQKIFVLSTMPSIVMLMLERDDIQDCLLWAAGVASVGIIAFRLSIRGEGAVQSQSVQGGRTVKVDKIQ